ncbi:MAG: YIP1 family protein [Xanthobacteraceae bacterium]
MNVHRRAQAMLVDPAAEWVAIASEPGDPAYVLSRYVTVLALVPAASSFIGSSMIGVVTPNLGLLRAPLFNGVFGAIFGYVISCASVLVLGIVINLVAPLFGSRRGFDTPSGLRSIPTRRSGSPEFFCCCRACAF